MSAKELLVGFCMSAVLASVAKGGQPRPKPLSIGDPAPDFQGVQLEEDDAEKTFALASFKDSKLLVVCFTCTRCPFSRAYEDRFNTFAEDYKKKGVKFVAINVNRDENAKMIRSRRDEKGFKFPYLYDASGKSARSYRATTTPELFVFDKDRKLVYHGAFDDSLTKPSRDYVHDAVDRVLSGRRPLRMRTTPYGTPILLR